MATKIRSLEFTTKMLQTFFQNTLGDEVTVQEIYTSWGRSTDDESKNKQWLSGSMQHLKHHDLATAVYERRNSRKTLVGLKLTEKGKAILGKNHDVRPPMPEAAITPTNTNQPLNYESMMSLVARFQRENPQYKVKFAIELKEDGLQEMN